MYTDSSLRTAKHIPLSDRGGGGRLFLFLLIPPTGSRSQNFH